MHVAGTAPQNFPTTPGVVVPTVQPPPPGNTYAYGFAAVIDASKQGGSVCFANATSATAEIGTSTNASFDIVNCGNGPLTISSAQVSPGVFTRLYLYPDGYGIRNRHSEQWRLSHTTNVTLVVQ